MHLLRLITTVALITFITTGRGQANPEVVATIIPVHALVAGVMDGVGAPYLIVRGGASPHTWSLRPTDAQRLATASIVFWIGPTMEAFMAKSIGSLAQAATVVELDRAPGVATLRARGGGPWEADDDEPVPERAAGASEVDGHLWLDPRNAAAIVNAAEAALISVDPRNADQYRTNAARMRTRLATLDEELERQFEAVRHQPFVVFHDAYQYLERRYALKAVGSITVSPELQPGAKRLEEVRQKLRSLQARCVFREPQFEPRLLAVVTEGTRVRQGVLDPEGADLTPGADAYFALMRRLAGNLSSCLAHSS